MKQLTLNGKRIAYDINTEFYVQVGKNKSKYISKYKTVGNLDWALIYYNKLEVSDGFKKRLYVPSFNKPTVLRETTEGASATTLQEFISEYKDDSHVK